MQAWKAEWFNDAEYLQMSGWGLERDFKEVPSHLLRASLWSPCLWGRWDYEANILELEARVLVKGLRRVALSTFGHDIRQLLLVDNLSVCLEFDRSRGSSYSLLQQICKFSTYCMARNISCTVRWVPSELKIADEPSRLHSEEDHTGLAHVIPAIRRSSEGEATQASTPPGRAIKGALKSAETCSRAGKSQLECESLMLRDAETNFYSSAGRPGSRLQGEPRARRTPRVSPGVR